MPEIAPSFISSIPECNSWRTKIVSLGSESMDEGKRTSDADEEGTCVVAGVMTGIGCDVGANTGCDFGGSCGCSIDEKMDILP